MLFLHQHLHTHARVSSPGFLLFVGLAVYFATHPPTPLAVTAEHLDGLWHELAAEVHSLHLGDRASGLTHSLQDSICSNSLLHRVQSVGHSLTDNLHSLQESVAHKLHAVESSLQHSAAHLGSGLAERAGALQGVLRQQLRPIVTWPTPRWPVYIYFAGACVCMLTSGVCHLLGCCSQHIAEMVWRFDYAGVYGRVRAAGGVSGASAGQHQLPRVM
jgi:adiponectin receptor